MAPPIVQACWGSSFMQVLIWAIFCHGLMSYEIFHRTVTNTESYLPSFLLLLLIDVNKIDIMYSFCDLFLAAPSLDWIAEGSIEVQLIAFDV